MKKYWSILLLLVAFSPAQASAYQHGTIVRMHMTGCVDAHRGFMAALSGGQVQATTDLCPEYTLVSDKVVYRIIGKNSNSVVPLAEITPFRFQNNELLIRVDDDRRESRFVVMEMKLRAEWEQERERAEQEEENANLRRRMQTDMAMGSPR